MSKFVCISIQNLTLPIQNLDVAYKRQVKLNCIVHLTGQVKQSVSQHTQNFLTSLQRKARLSRCLTYRVDTSKIQGISSNNFTNMIFFANNKPQKEQPNPK